MNALVLGLSALCMLGSSVLGMSGGWLPYVAAALWCGYFVNDRRASRTSVDTGPSQPTGKTYIWPDMCPVCGYSIGGRRDDPVYQPNKPCPACGNTTRR